MRIGLVDEHPLHRAGLALALRAVPELEVVCEGQHAVDAWLLACTVPLDVVIAEAFRSIPDAFREYQPACRVLVHSSTEEPRIVADLLRAGAAGYSLKSQSGADLVEAIRVVGRGDRYLAPALRHEAIEAELLEPVRDHVGDLSAREREVCGLWIRGFTIDEIASLLCISQRTVESHRIRISTKLATSSLAELQRITARHERLSTEPRAWSDVRARTPRRA